MWGLTVSGGHRVWAPHMSPPSLPTEARSRPASRSLLTQTPSPRQQLPPRQAGLCTLSYFFPLLRVRGRCGGHCLAFVEPVGRIQGGAAILIPHAGERTWDWHPAGTHTHVFRTLKGGRLPPLGPVDQASAPSRAVQVPENENTAAPGTPREWDSGGGGQGERARTCGRWRASIDHMADRGAGRSWPTSMTV